MTAVSTTTPIVWTIAGSDSGGGAGIQADLLTLHDFDVHACTVITALTAQNSVAVQQTLVTEQATLMAQIQALDEDLPAAAIKLGMLANADTLRRVSEYISGYSCPVVCDPVMWASSGDALLSNDSIDLYQRYIFPYATIITPNQREAEQLSGITIRTEDDMVDAAHALLVKGANSVLITGGHLSTDSQQKKDYWSNGQQACWLAGEAIDTPHSHGSGCTLSAAITALLARGYALLDALVVAKAYTTVGIRYAQAYGRGAGPVAHLGWPYLIEDWPRCAVSRAPAGPSTTTAKQTVPRVVLSPPLTFPDCDGELGLYPVVDDVSWLEKLLPLGIQTIQLRIKDQTEQLVREQMAQAVQLARQYHARLFINDYAALAVEYGAYGVHLGQEDLDQADLQAIRRAGLRLGVSTHTESEIARAHAIEPSYIALGPVYPTTSKVMCYPPLGLHRLQRWVDLLQQRYTLTAIGGISVDRAADVLATGVRSCAMISAITQVDDYQQTVRQLLALHDSATTPLVQR